MNYDALAANAFHTQTTCMITLHTGRVARSHCQSHAHAHTQSRTHAAALALDATFSRQTLCSFASLACVGFVRLRSLRFVFVFGRASARPRARARVRARLTQPPKCIGIRIAPLSRSFTHAAHWRSVRARCSVAMLLRPACDR